MLAVHPLAKAFVFLTFLGRHDKVKSFLNASVSGSFRETQSHPGYEKWLWKLAISQINCKINK